MPVENHHAIEVVEFNWPLFVYQRRSYGGGEYLFTIAVWKGAKLLPICHLQPFQTALDALGQALITAEWSQSEPTTSAVSDRNDLNSGHAEACSSAEPLSPADDNGQS